MNHRLQQFLAAENVSQAQFAEFLGVARASVSHILAGRNKPSYEFICSMMVHYPNLNMEWLLTGKGKMYKNVSDSPSASELFFAPEKPEVSEDLPEEGSDILFPEAEEPSAYSPSAQFSSSIISKTQIAQTPINQRKVLKVTILFDDGTYQEL